MPKKRNVYNAIPANEDLGVLDDNWFSQVEWLTTTTSRGPCCRLFLGIVVTE